jgi:integrase
MASQCWAISLARLLAVTGMGREMPQHREPRRPFDQRPDRRAPEPQIQDLVGLAQHVLEFLDALLLDRRRAGSHAAVTLALAHPLAQRLADAVDLGHNRLDRHPMRRVPTPGGQPQRHAGGCGQCDASHSPWWFCAGHAVPDQALRHATGRAFSVSELQAEDLRGFIAQELTRVNSVSHATALASALRAYFRYRSTCGDVVHALLGVIASPARWALATLPRALTPQEVQRLMTHCEQTRSSPRRLLAMVRLALDLGLRAGEIARLELCDIGWRAGTLTLKRTKSVRQDVLPLPAATGEALAEYLRHERPTSTMVTVFVRRHAPHDQPVGVDVVRDAIGNALRHAGIPHGRSHSLRHTLACRLVNSGGSIKEVADVLRHRSLNTSLIYAKLDQQRLAEVALPWFGSAA